MGDLPTGTVTMLFSDIEGSTALLSRLGDRYGQALSDHRVLLRAAFAAWRGREISTEGDSFFVVFSSAGDAVACTLAAQRALAGHDWPGGDAVQVRMGLHSDHAFLHGVCFVALAAVGDTEMMWKTLAGDLDVDGDGSAAVLEHLRDRRMLLVLDNLEQIAGAGEVAAALLAAASGLVLLATSRGPLHVPGEQEFPVPPLEVPREADVAEVADAAAVRLFAQQAGLVRPAFAVTKDNAADVAAICRRLDGLPLAIELAAARVKLLAPKALLARLGQTLGLASAEAGRPLRQQTLRSTIGWSYELLSPGLRRWRGAAGQGRARPRDPDGPAGRRGHSTSAVRAQPGHLARARRP